MNSCLHEPYTIITCAQRFILREAFSLIPHGDFGGCDSIQKYIIHKCEKQGMSLKECRRFLSILDLHDIHCRTDGRGCRICLRLRNYRPAT
jgi:hypothetical protein